MDLLRGHPALAARLFDIKQDCLWQYIILGEAKPFGTVTDYWRRVEVAPLFLSYIILYFFFFFVLNVFHICVMYLYFIFFYSCSIRLAELLTFTV